jgi:hypothetical protein
MKAVTVSIAIPNVNKQIDPATIKHKHTVRSIHEVSPCRAGEVI